MRHASLALGAVLVLAGCNLMKPGVPNSGTPEVAKPQASPTAEALVKYLNDNANRIQSIDCGDLDLDAKQGIEAVSLNGWMVCQKPRNFRMGAKLVGSQAVDMGSNNDEFWWWISKGDPYLFHCSYSDLQNNKARMPFPFQPEWMMAALGMGEYGPAANYTVNVTQKTYELAEQVRSPNGGLVRKVTVFNRQPFYVSAHVLQDEKNKVVCAAYITAVQTDAGTGAVLPKQVKIECPQEKMELTMTLRKPTVNQPIDQQRTARLFTRPQLNGVPTFDLAHGPEQGQALRRTGATETPR
jgi:hypothetical protein